MFEIQDCQYPTVEELKELGEVLIQIAEGKKVECRRRSNEVWTEKTDFTGWFPATYKYRVAPPEPKEAWINFSDFNDTAWAYLTENEAWRQVQSEYSYKAIAVHFKEVRDNE